MSDRVRKGCVIPAVLILVSLICGSVFLYFGLRQAGINIQGFIGSGGEAAVDVPAGFEVNIFAEGLNGPRFMAVGPDGVLYVADRANDRVVARLRADQSYSAPRLWVHVHASRGSRALGVVVGVAAVRVRVSAAPRRRWRSARRRARAPPRHS